MSQFMYNYQSPNGEFVVTIEDDGKVAYAYLKRENQIVGDVWLYNRCATPSKPEWTDPNNIPFANCAEYMSNQGHFIKPITQNDINVDWENDSGVFYAYVYVFNDLLGVVGVGDKPGYARFAVKDGPLARVMVIDDDH